MLWFFVFFFSLQIKEIGGYIFMYFLWFFSILYFLLFLFFEVAV